jgi:hypothetical protein
MGGLVSACLIIVVVSLVLVKRPWSGERHDGKQAANAQQKPSVGEDSTNEARLAKLKKERLAQEAVQEEESRKQAAVISVEREKKQEEDRRSADVERERREAEKPLKVFLGGELRGIQAAYYRQLPRPKLQSLAKGKGGSVFDKADQPDWDSKYAIEKIPLAPGATMDLKVANYPKGVIDQHCEWSWSISLAVPPGVTTYKGVSFEYAFGDKVDRYGFELVGVARVDGMSLAYYEFHEQWNPIPTLRVHRPIDKIVNRIITEGSGKYRIITGPKDYGPSFEGEFSTETAQAISAILRKAVYKNWMDRPEYGAEWMKH